MSSVKSKNSWEINAHAGWWDINFKEWWLYRHLLARLVRREFLLNYQQTVLGPAWILLQPIFTLIIYVLVFGKIIGIPLHHTDPVLFYLAGIILWNFFNDTFLGTAFTFTQNAYLFSKVYFPRLVVPLSSLAANFLRFLIQLLLLAFVMVYFYIFRHWGFRPNIWIVFLPVVLLMVGVISFSLGTIFSVLTAKYRDLINIVHLGIRMLMFVTPVLYPASVLSSKIKWLLYLNPLSPVFEVFRYALLGEGIFNFRQLIYSLCFTVFILLASISLYSKQGDKLIDVV
ncbi:MAG: ABC transporter permease [Flavisolibacter sp.]